MNTYNDNDNYLNNDVEPWMRLIIASIKIGIRPAWLFNEDGVYTLDSKRSIIDCNNSNIKSNIDLEKVRIIDYRKINDLEEYALSVGLGVCIFDSSKAYSITNAIEFESHGSILIYNKDVYNQDTIDKVKELKNTDMDGYRENIGKILGYEQPVSSSDNPAKLYLEYRLSVRDNISPETRVYGRELATVMWSQAIFDNVDDVLINSAKYVANMNQQLRLQNDDIKNIMNDCGMDKDKFIELTMRLENRT